MLKKSLVLSFAFAFPSRRSELEKEMKKVFRGPPATIVHNTLHIQVANFGSNKLRCFVCYHFVRAFGKALKASTSFPDTFCVCWWIVKQIGLDYLEVYFCLLRGNKKFCHRGKTTWSSLVKKVAVSHPFSIWLQRFRVVVVQARLWAQLL